MVPEGGHPTAREIEDQLQRMLASDRFRLADKQSEFLAFVVKRALGGKKSPGHIIAKELFPDTVCKTADGQLRIVGNHVRQTANNLRRTLVKYQAEEGREDPIVISLPEPHGDRTVKLAEGEAYTPQFAYNSIHPVTTELTLGNHFHRHQLIGEEKIALRHFAKALAICPEHIDAAIGVTEACCALRAWGQKVDDEFGPVLDKAVDVLDADSLRGSKYWRVHAAIANLFWHMEMPINQVAEHFEQAKALDRIRTESHQPYLLFLLHSGRVEEALRLSKRSFEAHQDDSRACIPYLGALMAAKRYTCASCTNKSAASKGYRRDGNAFCY